jgi:SAM-dependent methyltransferase
MNDAYAYLDVPRASLLRIIPMDGVVIGSVGCGTGATEEVLVGLGREVHGVDVALAPILIAATRLTSARVINPEDKYPFDANSLDGLILADVLEHMPAPWSRLEEYAKMVKIGGWVAISGPNMRYADVLFSLTFSGDWREAPMGIYDRTHLQVFTHNRVERWARDIGLDLVCWGREYDYRFFRRKIFQIADVVTFFYFHKLLTPAVVGIFRKK